MRSLLLASTVIAAAAMALPAAAQTDPGWSGVYVGANIGGNWGRTSSSQSGNPGNGSIVIPPADLARINQLPSFSSNDTGFTGGIEGGYNWLFGNVLLGIETDYQAYDLNQSLSQTATSGLNISPPITYTLTQRLHTNWMWTLRPRLGYVAGPWLVYATGGIATTNIKYSLGFADTNTPPNAVSQTVSDQKTGWTTGLGAAYAITPNWSVKGEYLYANFGNIRTTAATPTGFVSLTSQAEVTASLLRVGVDYRF